MTDRAGQLYRRVIDRLVHDTLQGQGRIVRDRVQHGVWNPHATPEALPEQVAINDVLARLSEGDRSVLAGVIAVAFRAGVHQALLALHEEAIPPFDLAYEGTPFHDYIGRLDGWEWPRDPTARRT
jgi:hypothetical protein